MKENQDSQTKKTLYVALAVSGANKVFCNVVVSGPLAISDRCSQTRVGKCCILSRFHILLASVHFYASSTYKFGAFPRLLCPNRLAHPGTQ